ncbi:thiolase C-terminal domain-containing protein [Pseudonocardia pini]|uniref:thiolase C-terminal domain-containing protein n=1 Tax=Pseudonocardia pini TaxID=2758030 RepID=UPI0015F08919|nr:acetyl-CoA acetyltransferase [Pseudonocardia pini]
MTDVRALRGAAAVAGIGWTPFRKASGVSPLALAVRAVRAALDDAGLDPAEVDGLGTHHLGDTAQVHEVAKALGLDGVGWFSEEYGGGNRFPALLGDAALAVASGVARHVVLYRALNGRSGVRMGGATRPMPGPDLQWQQPYGVLTPAHNYGFAARAHMQAYGTTSAQLGAVAVAQRCAAVLNERAMMRTPLTLDDYLEAPEIVDPFRLYDYCLETDAGCAVLVTTTERARDLRRRPVTIEGWAAQLGRDDLTKPDLTTSTAATIAPRLYALAGRGPDDVDVAELYDAFTFTVLVQVEDYGFCAKGEGGPFVESGATALGGRIPVNTHGGFLSEGYVHGINHVCEAVSQLRGDAGARQVPGAETALVSAQPGYLTGGTSAVLLGVG